MRVFVAGSTGTIGKSLLPLLVKNGHDVVALVRTSEKGRSVEELGAKATVANALDRDDLTAAIKRTAPEVILHELTALSNVSWNFRRFDDEFGLTNRFRTEVTDTLLAAARLVGARRFIAQSFCGWPFARCGGPIKTEEDPLDPTPPASFRKTLAAIRYLEETVSRTADIEGIALRYGNLYGPCTGFAKDGLIAELVQKRQMPIIGDGAGIWSFIHVDDAARATMAALSHGAPGVYNIVDDEPAPVSSWIPFLADVLGANPPRRVPALLASLVVGGGGVSMMTTVRGGSNAKAKRELGWQPTYPSWRWGFFEDLG